MFFSWTVHRDKSLREVKIGQSEIVAIENRANLSRHMMWGVYLLLLLKFTVGLLPVSDGFDSRDVSSSLEETIIKYDNNLNGTHYKTMSDRQIVDVHRRNFDPDDLKATYTSNSHPRFDQHPFHCSACQFRSIFAKASLKSIKAHVLLKLGFEYPPNQTNYPKVPDNILRSFNDKIDYNQNPRMSEAGDSQYMGDDPRVVDEQDGIDNDSDYYQITNKIFILPNRIKPLRHRFVFYSSKHISHHTPHTHNHILIFSFGRLDLKKMFIHFTLNLLIFFSEVLTTDNFPLCI
ncbi:uncharacterized protein LOC129779907 [Toxorhynchites rutilus septentrionalis]|uniref:uncharacterized protein LOC129779907 n=1 Tax=Toxorhynchites rutilus septentrionalis TaxID=329112 RepID=UPI002479DD9C|nr:uncharacterized protein LOC129779907 [Toxorhynchites rutilus septentrionalis]